MMSWIFGGGGNARVAEKKPEKVESESRPVEESDWLGDVDGGVEASPEVEVRIVPMEEKKEVSRLQYLKIDEGAGAVECSCGAVG